MKKILAVILALTFVFALCSCSDKENSLNSSFGASNIVSETEGTSSENLSSGENVSKIEGSLNGGTENSPSSNLNAITSEDKTSSAQNSGSFTSVMEKNGKWVVKYLTQKDLTFSQNKELIYLTVILSPVNDAYVNSQHGILLDDLIPPDRELVKNGDSGIKSDEFEGEKYYYFTGSSNDVSSIEESGKTVTLTLSEGKMVLERLNETTMKITEAENFEIVGKKLMFLPQ